MPTLLKCRAKPRYPPRLTDTIKIPEMEGIETGFGKPELRTVNFSDLGRYA